MRNRLSAVCVLVLAACLVLTCASSEEPPDAGAAMTPAQRVESPALSIALAQVPAGFRLEANEGETLRLATADPAMPGTLTFEAGPVEQAGINLVEAVNEQKARLESLPEGRFLGQVEMMGPTGTAYSTRGRYLLEDGTQTEEIRMFTLHPSGENRMLSLVYVYPPVGDSRERINQGMTALGEVEYLAPAAPAPPTADGAETEEP